MPSPSYLGVRIWSLSLSAFRREAVELVQTCSYCPGWGSLCRLPGYNCSVCPYPEEGKTVHAVLFLSTVMPDTRCITLATVRSGEISIVRDDTMFSTRSVVRSRFLAAASLLLSLAAVTTTLPAPLLSFAAHIQWRRLVICFKVDGFRCITHHGYGHFISPFEIPLIRKLPSNRNSIVRSALYRIVAPVIASPVSAEITLLLYSPQCGDIQDHGKK